LVKTQGKPAALAHLAKAGDRFPHHQPLYQLRLQWIQDEPPEVREPVIRRAAELNPHDAWLHRELALFLAEQRRPAEAWPEADVAGQLDPNAPAYFYVCAQLMRDEGKIDEAKATLREAIRLSVDYRCAIDESMALCASAAQRRELLEFVKDELVRQVTFGDGLLAFRSQAHGTLQPAELLAILREARQARPDLWHAWSACIQQLLAVDRRDEAWELAQQATERFPLRPPLWLDRAATCRAREDWQGEREALETACQINPDWGQAVRTLAEFHERQGEFDETRRLLQRATARQPLDAKNHILLAEFLWRHKEKEAALERICRAVELDPGHARAWRCLKGWGDELGRRQVAADVARKLTERRAGEARSWFLLAESLDGPEQIEERLASLDKAVAMNPRFVQAYDLRAIVLAGAKRWEDAQKACCPPPWGDNLPVELRGRAAWIEAQRGNLREAIARMEKVLDDEPGYHTGWCWIWEWQRGVKNYAGCIAAGEALTRLNPQDEIGMGYLAEAHRLDGNRQRAETLFQRAFDLNPRYDFAGFALFDLQMTSRDFKAAAATLALLERHSANAFVEARAVQLEASLAMSGAKRSGVARAARATSLLLGMTPAERENRLEAAIGHLKKVCATARGSEWPVTFAVKMMSDAGWREAATKVLAEAMCVDGAHVEVGRQWVRLCIAQKKWSCGKRLRELARRGPIGVEAAVVYVELMAKEKRMWRFRRFFWRNKDWLCQHARTWGVVGYAMARFRWHARLVSWMDDWRERKNLESWMLANLVDGLRALGRDSEAAEASRLALTLRPDHCHPTHRVWLAADAACNGEIDVARNLLATPKQTALSADDAFIEKLAAAVVEMAAAGPREKPYTFLAAQRKLSGAVAQYKSYNRDRSRRRLYRKCLRVIADKKGGFAARIWFWTRRLSS
jgi:tetratricopeptide (TPR) repeat protein